jgi:hypothetical protein
VIDQPLTPFAEGVWLASSPVRIVGTRLTTTMAVLRLGDGGLLLYSPVAMTPERRAAVQALGPVTHLYAPNTFHHLWLGEWADAFPSARVHAPASLAKKYRKQRRGLRIDRAHGPGAAPEPGFAGVIDEVPIAGFRLFETVLVYHPARAALVADLAHNVGRPSDRWTVAYTRMMGFYDRVALSGVIRWTGFADRAAARRSVDQLLALPFDRLIVGHGSPLPAGGHAALAAAYTWLR